MSSAELKALTIPKLKELLVAQSLPTTGKKDELIARLLAIDSTASDAVPAPSDESPSTATESTPVVATAPAPAKPTPTPFTEEEIKERTSVEEEKRKARALKFGIDLTPAPTTTATAATTTTEGEGKDAKLKSRKERFGIAEEKPVDLNKSVAALDQPLGANKPERKAKVVATTGLAIAKAQPVVEKKVEVVDPELQAKQAAEEEKRVKRAARFGAPAAAEEPAEKKLKTVA